MAKIITLGEIMLRLSTPHYNRFVQSESFDVVYGGSEANVAISLACFHHDAYFISKVPKHEIGQSVINVLRQYGVHTDYVVRGGDRLGIYFLETGSSMRASSVIYDRANSSMALANLEDFDFNEIMKDASWFHFSGITPAISKQGALITKKACEAAKRHGVKVSCDLNFRSKLWSEEQAQEVMIPLMEYVDVCIGNPEAVVSCLGIGDKNTHIDECEEIFKELCGKFNFEYIAYTFRDGDSAVNNGYQAIIYNGKETYISKRYHIDSIVDRIGAGDAFTAGLIHGLLSDMDYQDALEFGIAAGAYKHTIKGDYLIASIDEIASLVKGNTIGKIKR